MMLHFLLIYQLADGYLERRGEFREAHLKLAQEAADAGTLMLAGALETPVDQAMLLFHDQTAARQFAAADPYVTHGLVTSWSVRRWNTVINSLKTAED